MGVVKIAICLSGPERTTFLTEVAMPDKLYFSPAEYVIYIFKGVRATARNIGRSAPAISRWRQPKHKGGTDGCIPSGAIATILRLAKENNLPITPADLILGRTVTNPK